MSKPAKPPAPSTTLEPSEAEEALAGVDGKVKSKLKNQAGQLVEDNPDETVSVLRRWMEEE